MRTIFMGAPPFAVPALRRLVAIGADLVGVYTKEPQPAGRRGLKVTKTAVHLAAEALGAPVFTPANFKAESDVDAFRALDADVAIVAAYGLILPRKILSAPRFGCLNLHGSLLPRWRGAAPVQRAIMAGDALSAVALMRMEAGLDTGPVAREFVTRIGASETSAELMARLAELGADLVEASFPAISTGTLAFRAQWPEGVTYARKIEKAEAVIDWRRSALEIRNLIHGLSPQPGAYSHIALNGQVERFKFLRAELVEGEGEPGVVIGPDFRIACGRGAIRALETQRAGKTPTSGDEAIRGARALLSGRFSSEEPGAAETAETTAMKG